MLGEIISVGDELLEGRIVNENTAFLAQELTYLGIEVINQQTVRDNAENLQASLQLALNRADITVLTGGLGPTRDDLTKEVVAETLGTDLIYDENEYYRIQKFFERLGRDMSDNNKKQAYVPQNGEVLINDVGTASGVYIKQNGKIVVLLPGPPREMQYIFKYRLKPRLERLMQEQGTAQLSTRTLKLIGIGESMLDEQLAEIDFPKDVCEIIPLAKRHQVHLVVKCRHKDKRMRNRSLAMVTKQLYWQLSEFIWGEDEQELEHMVVSELIECGKTIAVAESMTGGLFTGTLTDVPGASKVLLGGITAYTGKGKSTSLNISNKFLNEHSHVSETTSQKLAEQVKDLLEADIGIGITGYAGPDDENQGLFHTVIIGDTHQRNLSRKLPGKRENVKRGAVLHSLNEVRKFLSDY